MNHKERLTDPDLCDDEQYEPVTHILVTKCCGADVRDYTPEELKTGRCPECGMVADWKVLK